jgi:hypothetical protein
MGDETYTFSLDLNAMTLIEDHFSTAGKDVSFYEAFDKMQKTGSARYIRAFVWAGLQRHHKGLSLDAVGDLIQQSGGLLGFGDKLRGAIAEAGLATIPDKADLHDLGVDANGRNPTKARPGRGARSTSTRVPSV